MKRLRCTHTLLWISSCSMPAMVPAQLCRCRCAGVATVCACGFRRVGRLLRWSGTLGRDRGLSRRHKICAGRRVDEGGRRVEQGVESRWLSSSAVSTNVKGALTSKSESGLPFGP